MSKTDDEILEMIDCFKKNIINRYELSDLSAQIVDKHGEASKKVASMVDKIVGGE